MDLHERWMKFCQFLGAENGEIIWNWLSSAYNEKHRYYHTLTHIESCLTLLDEWLVENPEYEHARSLLEFAFWFHDSVYDTKIFDNEEQSSLLAKNAIGVMGIDLDLECVRQLIIMTKHHAYEGKHYDILPNIFLDIDLSILGAVPDVFKQYHRDIRKEYNWVPVEIYQAKRLEILKGFRDRKQIFKTKFFQDKFEIQAKENLMRAILVSEDAPIDPVC